MVRFFSWHKCLRGNRNDFAALHLQNLLVVFGFPAFLIFVSGGEVVRGVQIQPISAPHVKNAKNCDANRDANTISIPVYLALDGILE